MIGEKVICYNEKSNTIQDFEDKLDNIIIMLNNSGIKNRGWSKIKIGFISGNGENPLKNVLYFKYSLQEPFKVDNYSSFMAPKNCQEYIYRIYIDSIHQINYAKSLWRAVIKI